MSDRFLVNSWLRDLSPDGAALELDEAGICALSDEHGHVVRIEVPEASGRVYLVSHLGPWSEDRTGVAVALMKANFLGLETNGASFAIDERSAQLALGFSEAVGHLNAQKLQTVIERFFDLRQRWGDQIRTLERAGAAQAPQPAPQADDEPMVVWRL